MLLLKQLDLIDNLKDKNGGDDFLQDVDAVEIRGNSNEWKFNVDTNVVNVSNADSVGDKSQSVAASRLSDL